MFKKFFICFVLLSTGVNSLGMFSSRKNRKVPEVPEVPEVPTIKSFFDYERIITIYVTRPSNSPEEPKVSAFEVSLNGETGNSETGRCSKSPKKPKLGMFYFRKNRKVPEVPEVPTIKSSFDDKRIVTIYVTCPSKSPEEPKVSAFEVSLNGETGNSEIGRCSKSPEKPKKRSCLDFFIGCFGRK